MRNLRRPLPWNAGAGDDIEVPPARMESARRGSAQVEVIAERCKEYLIGILLAICRDCFSGCQRVLLGLWRPRRVGFYGSKWVLFGFGPCSSRTRAGFDAKLERCRNAFAGGSQSANSAAAQPARGAAQNPRGKTGFSDGSDASSNTHESSTPRIRKRRGGVAAGRPSN